MDQVIPASILGIVQGLSEFLPISSSGHLIIFPKLFGWSGVVDSLEFDVALHVGTTVAVVWFFWEDWVKMVKSFLSGLKTKNLTKEFESKLLLLILLGSVPAGIVGIGFKNLIEENTRQPLLVAVTLFSFGLLLWSADKAGQKNRSFTSIGWLDAGIIGTVQAISLVPGVSRSGITITAGLFKGLNREAATRFSFLLSTPAIIGAAVISAKDLFGSSSQGNMSIFVVGTVAAAISGWFAIKFLLKFVSTHNFNIFVWYRIILALLLLILFLG
ncbi:MAG: undecaprenyl-diphosphatase UppP [bacterium]|nr:undecaprenyl-diphosphatase UppP [bacterium]